jgi:tetratricopeptide (TPR) repeat protein
MAIRSVEGGVDMTITKQSTKKGSNFFLQKDEGKAREAHTLVIRLNSDNACLNGDRTKARDKTIAKYIKRILNPKSAKSYYNRGDAYESRGFAYCNKGDFKKALADFEQVVKMKPDDAFSYGARGSVYFEQGDYDKAIADYERALALTQDDSYWNLCTEQLEEVKEKKEAIK